MRWERESRGKYLKNDGEEIFSLLFYFEMRYNPSCIAKRANRTKSSRAEQSRDDGKLVESDLWMIRMLMQLALAHPLRYILQLSLFIPSYLYNTRAN